VCFNCDLIAARGWPRCLPDVLPAVAVCNFEDLLRTGFWAHIQMLFVGTVSGPSLKVFCGHGVRIQVQRLFVETVSRGKCKDLSRIRFRANILVDTVPGPSVNTCCGHGFCQQFCGFPQWGLRQFKCKCLLWTRFRAQL
jgi:hypothetical protein